MPDPQSTTSSERTGHANRAALDALYPQVYQELRRIAHQRLRQVKRGETLNTTALVHEVYLRLADQTRPEWQDRAHFFALASRAMRFILIDSARARSSAKRGGEAFAVPLDSIQIAADECAADLLSLNEALEQLSRDDARLALLIEYRFFGGLTYEEIARLTGVSVPTVKRDWRRARSWLFLRMQH